MENYFILRAALLLFCPAFFGYCFANFWADQIADSRLYQRLTPTADARNMVGLVGCALLAIGIWLQLPQVQWAAPGGTLFLSFYFPGCLLLTWSLLPLVREGAFGAVALNAHLTFQALAGLVLPPATLASPAPLDPASTLTASLWIALPALVALVFVIKFAPKMAQVYENRLYTAWNYSRWGNTGGAIVALVLWLLMLGMPQIGNILAMAAYSIGCLYIVRSLIPTMKEGSLGALWVNALLMCQTIWAAVIALIQYFSIVLILILACGTIANAQSRASDSDPITVIPFRGGDNLGAVNWGTLLVAPDLGSLSLQFGNNKKGGVTGASLYVRPWSTPITVSGKPFELGWGFGASIYAPAKDSLVGYFANGGENRDVIISSVTTAIGPQASLLGPLRPSVVKGYVALQPLALAYEWQNYRHSKLTSTALASVYLYPLMLSKKARNGYMAQNLALVATGIFDGASHWSAKSALDAQGKSTLWIYNLGVAYTFK